METLLRSGGLKPSGYVLAALLLLPVLAYAQETEPPDGTRISSATVSGMDLSRLSPGLQEEIGKLAGSSLNRQVLRDLAERIEGEQPRYVAAIRVLAEPPGEARVVFVVARIRDQGDINQKYIVDEVVIKGVPDRDVPPDVRTEAQALYGKPLDGDAADRITTQLKAAFPGYTVTRITSRAEERGRIKVIYILSKPEALRWLRFEPLDANALFHSDQGWGALLPLNMTSGDISVTPILAWDHADELVEEYGGFGIRVESRKVGTERVGLFFEWSTYDQEWRDQTILASAANPLSPGLYRNRMSFTPMGKFAFTENVSVAGGVGITEMDPLVEELGLPSQMANVAIGSVRYKQVWGPASRLEQQIGAAFTVRAGTTALESDFEYERYVGEAAYGYRRRGHRVNVAAMFGRINGTAPMFERFTLGDSRTLRGWDKYDINPLGGDRMFHTSAEYRFRAAMVFLDAGSVWETGTDKRIRFSTGAGFTPGPLFFILGFPLNTDEFRAVFTMGFRFGRSPLTIVQY